LFQYVDDAGGNQPIDSGMVNDYLREAMGEHEFTAKDFRTWGATLQALVFLCGQPCQQPVSQRAFNRCVAQTARNVAAVLGNTPAVCRRSYINPKVFELWRGGHLQRVNAARGLESRALKLLKSLDTMARTSNRRQRPLAGPPGAPLHARSRASKGLTA
jgi:DNA topoisomerase IB